MRLLYFHSEAAARRALATVNVADLRAYCENMEPGPAKRCLQLKLADIDAVRRVTPSTSLKSTPAALSRLPSSPAPQTHSPVE
jgi:hypothetical protein